VFEHSIDPRMTMTEILGMCDEKNVQLVLYTAISDQKINPASRLGWWYVAPRNGHVSIFSTSSLKFLMREFGLEYIGSIGSAHLVGAGGGGLPDLFRLGLAKLLNKMIH